MKQAIATLPSYYDSKTIGTLRDPDMQGAYEAGVQARGHVRAAAEDDKTVLAWLIDMQIDFVFPAPIGKLSVPGALEDTKRTIEWLYRNVGTITSIAASLDTHVPFMIFYPTWWINSQGENPQPYTTISAQDVREGKWMPVAEPDWSLYYVDQLESVGKKQLMIWPFHCMEGTAGRALVPELSEAISYHSAARYAQPIYLAKGHITTTEFYSVIEPEVKDTRHPDGGFNTAFADMVSSYDLIYVAGQARSHCVLETMRSVLRHFSKRPEILRKIRYLTDCSSSIQGFEKDTEAEVQAYAKQDIQLVQSTDPIA